LDFRFVRNRIEKNGQARNGFGTEFSVESYLNHQSKTFVERFDANSYLYITRAMDYYDAAAAWGGGNLIRACDRLHSELMVVSFSSDWLYPPAECREFVNAFIADSKPVTYVEIESASGHDAFLVDTIPVGRILRAYLLAPGVNRRFGAII
jgi:homoserine O-acetyltransferase